jgi:predicted ribosome quality control (RQC) complex YloA/Tae2 family protein
MGAIEARLADAATDEDLDRIEEELRREGIAVGLERGQRRGAPAPAEPREAGVRIYRSSEGYEILVGKGSEENDRLTFKIASPEDFWLHASGASGAHVVVRNPRSETRLPAATLREAAEIAAFYSKAKETGHAEVLVTRRKFVRRVRGAPRGTVTVKKHEALRVSPRHPFE